MLYQCTLDSIKALKIPQLRDSNPLQGLIIQDAAVLFHLSVSTYRKVWFQIRVMFLWSSMTFGLCFHFQFGIRCNMIIYAFTAVGALYLVKLFFTPEPEPIAGVYKVPGARYNVKYCFFRLILWLRQRKNKKLESTSGQNAGYGVRSRSSPEDMDKAQDLPYVNDHPKVKTPPTLTTAKTVKTNLNSVPVFHGIYLIYCHLAWSSIFTTMNLRTLFL